MFLYTYTNVCLNRLKEIPAPIASAATHEMLVQAINTYFSVCHKYHKTLTTLTFYNLKHQYYHLANNQWGSYFTFLPNFSNLTHLSLYNDVNYGGDRNLVIMIVLQIYPTALTHFAFYSNLPVPNIIANNMVTNMLKEGLRLQERGVGSLQNSINRKPQLKTFHLSLPCITRPYMQYIISYIPAQLDMFSLVMTDENLTFDGWLQHDEFLITVLEFESHLSAAKKLDIYMNKQRGDTQFVNNDNNNEVEERNAEIAGVCQKLNRFWQFGDAVKGRRAMCCHAYFVIYNLSTIGQQEEPTFHIRVNKNQEMEVEFGFD